MVRVLAVGAVIAGIAALVACSYPDCRYGMWPFAGQSGVAPDTTVVIQSRGALPRDLPSLHAAVGLEVVGGARVPVTIALDADAGAITLTPTAPLLPDTDYRVWGINQGALAKQHWRGSLGEQFTEARFTTASAPTLRVAGQLDEETGFVVFSEPMDLDSLDGRVLVADADGVEQALPVLDTLADAPHVVRVALPEDGDLAEVRVLAGAKARAGAPMSAAALAETVQWRDNPDEDLLGRYLGLAWCEA